MMEIVIKIPKEYYSAIKAIPDNQCDFDMLIIKNGTPLINWLSTFNTDSATECFTAVQRLKESVNDRLDEGNTR